MQKTCKQCQQDFEITEEDLVFYKKIEVPPPTFCPLCRVRRRCSHINTRYFFPRKVGSPERTRISMYSQDLELNIVDDEKWWADEYDMLRYGNEYDFDAPFFMQFHSLMKTVPLPHLQRAFSTFENSDYCNAAAGLKNCYMVTNADNCEDCMYGVQIMESKDCIDLMFCNKCELCYESVNLDNCYRCLLCEDCESCTDAVLCTDCISCDNCFGCIGLRQKSYHICNKPYSQEEYHRKMSEYSLRSWSTLERLKQEVLHIFQKRPHKYMQGRNNQNVHGDHIYQSKDVQETYIAKMAERCKYTHFLQHLDSGTHDAYDYTMFGVGADLMYEDAWCGLGVHNLKFCIWNYGSSDMEYCFGCHYSSDVFGCIGLRHQKYCILNKQYTEEEYRILVSKIKEQMMHVPYTDANGIEYRYGEFFPIELSPFHYNQTLAQDFYPLPEKMCRDLQYGWYTPYDRAAQDAMSWQDLPDDIHNVDESILQTTICCKAHDDNPLQAHEHNCSQFYKITKQELAFYKKMHLPIPRYCYNSRQKYRLQQINPFRTWDRTCDNCNKEIQTTYAPDRPEKVYCEECYLEEVY